MAVLTNGLFIVVMSMGVLYGAYKIYGSFLTRRVLGFDDSRTTPAVEQNDGLDYVPTAPPVLFGHHFASIAGLGPIIGPAIAVYWGWLPAIIWVLVGCILIGGVHDLAALYASLKYKARSIGDLTTDVIGPRARFLFLIIIFFLLALAMGAFAIVMAGLFTKLSPEAVLPTFSLIAIAMVMGVLVYRFKMRLGFITIFAVAGMFAMIFVGIELPIPLHKAFITSDSVNTAVADAEAAGITALPQQIAHLKAEESTAKLGSALELAQNEAIATWVYTLLAYALLASVLPVWLLLQPRDYINCFQLYAGLGLLFLGFLVAHPSINTPGFSAKAANDPSNPGMLPFIFITIACGAVSGFHNLVSSGTTARQLRKETDAKVIAYGGMLTEGLLAVFVIMACVAGLSSEDLNGRFTTFAGMTSAAALDAFLTGASRIVSSPFAFVLPITEASLQQFFKVFLSVMVVSFAMTTLDSGTRLLRYNVEAIGRSVNAPVLTNRYISSMVAVAAIGYMALMRIDGKPAGIILWQLFGTTNQLLAALGLIVVSLLLYKLGRPVVYTLIPAFVMSITVGWAIIAKLEDFYHGWQTERTFGYLSLLIVGLVLAILALWMVIEGFIAFIRLRNGARPIASISTT